MSRIIRDARAHDYQALVHIDADPETEDLLGLLPDRATSQAHTHLRGARAWQGQQRERAISKLDAARAALDALDIPLARGILRRVDSSFLDETGIVRRDELLLGVEARAVELEDIQRRLPPAPEAKKKGRKRFRGR